MLASAGPIPSRAPFAHCKTCTMALCKGGHTHPRPTGIPALALYLASSPAPGPVSAASTCRVLQAPLIPSSSLPFSFFSPPNVFLSLALSSARLSFIFSVASSTSSFESARLFTLYSASLIDRLHSLPAAPTCLALQKHLQVQLDFFTILYFNV